MSEQKKERDEEIEKLSVLFKEGVREEVRLAVTPIVQKQDLLSEKQSLLETEQNVLKTHVNDIETARDKQNGDLKKDNENTKTQVWSCRSK